MKFFAEDINSPIVGADAEHIKKSLRMKKGDEILVCCGGIDYNCKINQIDNNNFVFLDILSSEVCKSEPNLYVRLFQGVPKGDKMDFIIQKAVELGVSEVHPFTSDFSVPRFPTSDTAKIAVKTERFNKISLEAAKQSKRGKIPKIFDIKILKKVLQNLNSNAIILYENNFGGKRLSELNLNDQKSDALDIIVGAEGGFSVDEVKLAVAAGAVPVWLGERILRCETASLAVLSVIMYKSGNL